MHNAALENTDRNIAGTDSRTRIDQKLLLLDESFGDQTEILPNFERNSGISEN